MATAKKKKTNKRHRVNVGDMVIYRSPQNHSYGVLGEVTHILDSKRVVAKALAPGDSDYEDARIVLETREPTGTLSNGTARVYYTNYITKVVLRAKPKPPKKPKKVIPAKVIETQAELLEHLRSDSTEKVVVQLTEQGASA